MKSVLLLVKDPWFVLAAVLAATSGAAALSGRTVAGKAPAGTAAPSSSAQAPPSGGAPAFPAPVVPPAFPSVQAPSAGAGPSIQGPGFSRIIQSKTPGRWIVDAAKAKDSDSDALADAVANAKEGDTILLRPGAYQGGVRIEKSLVILGQPAGGKMPVIEVDGKADTLELRQGTLRMEDLVVRQSQGSRYALSARAGTLALKRVSVDSESSYGFYNRGADVTAEASSFRARDYGLEHQEGSLICSACTIAGSGKRGLSVGRDVRKAHFTDARVFDNGSAGGVSIGGPATFERSHIYRNKGAGVWVERGLTGPVRMTDCKVYENIGTGLIAAGGESVLEGLQAHRNNDDGLRAFGNARVRLVGFSAQENGGAGLNAYASAEVDLQGGELKANKEDGLSTSGTARAVLKNCRVHQNLRRGLWAAGDSKVEIDGCDFSGNRDAYKIGDQASVTGRSVPPLPAPQAGAKR